MPKATDNSHTLVVDGAAVPPTAAASGSHTLLGAAPGTVVVDAADPRYAYLNTRGQNRRFGCGPKLIYVPFTTEQTRDAVQAVVEAGLHVSIRSGGHCLDKLVDHAAVQSVIDVSQLNAVSFDPLHKAFSIGAGAMLGEVYRELYAAYGVVVPGGTCPTVGMGGYVAGGGFGAMSREHGLIVDHLHGVEAVVVDGSGRARCVLATRDPADPHHGLWWALTGAGGGNYGVVTRFLFRSPQATGSDPGALLPRPPAATLVTTVRFPWETMKRDDFTTLLRNHGAWHAANSVAGGEYDSLFSALILGSHATGGMALVCQFDAMVPNAVDLVNAYLAALTAGVSAQRVSTQSAMPWMTAVYSNLYGGAVIVANRTKCTGAYLRKPYDEEQIGTLYDRLSDTEYDGLGSVVLFSYGCRVTEVDPAATAVSHRDSILKVFLGAAWADADQDERHVDWCRTFYRSLYAKTGGVPVINDATDGSYINYPNVDLLDPEWNASGVAWHTLYFKDNYPRLQAVKAQYDPGDVFRHPLSVRLP